MSRKEFAHNASGYVLFGDERDIAVPYSKRQEVYEWCVANKISVEYQVTLSGVDVWRVRDDQQRMWFNMRWA